MKIGIMSFAHHHAEDYIGNVRALHGVEMIGIADVDAARGQHYAQQYDARLFPSYASLLAEKPDGVIVCTENVYHRPVVELAAQAGVHVLCEKPLAMNVAEAEAMVSAVEKAGVPNMVWFNYRRVPAIAAKVALVAGFASIALGYFVPSLAAVVDRMHEFHFLGAVFAALIALMLIIGAVQPRADHNAGQTYAHQPFEEKCGFFAVLQSDRAECP